MQQSSDKNKLCKMARNAVLVLGVAGLLAYSSYIAIVGRDFHYYDTRQDGESLYATKTTVNRRLFSESYHSEQFIDNNNDRRLEFYRDSRDSRTEGDVQVKHVIYMARHADAEIPAEKWNIIPNTHPNLVIRDRSLGIEPDSIEKGIVVFIMTEDEERYFDKRFLEALSRSE